MIKKITIITIWFCCLWAAKPGFSQCGTVLAGIDSIGSTAYTPIDVVYSDSNGNLYISGGFSKVNTTIVNGIFKWDGSNIYALGQGLTGGGGLIKVFQVYKNKIYMGGVLMKLIISRVREILLSGMG